jgi:hypothetical protein
MRIGIGRRLFAVGVTLVLGHAIASCGPTATTCEENATCPASGGEIGGGGAGGVGGGGGVGGVGGADGSAGAGGASEGGVNEGAASDGGAEAAGDASADGDSAPCDGKKSPSEAACVIDEAYGVFVSAAAGDAGTPGGGDAGSPAGTRKNPYRTLAEGLAAGKKNNLRVYACGAFATPVAIDGALDGVRVYGGFDCVKWAYSAATPTIVKPAAPGVALKVDRVTTLTIEDFEIDALDAAAPGESSVAAIVSASAGVTFTRVKLVAGKGGDGAAGADGAKGNDGDAAAGPQQGSPATCTSGGTSQPGGAWANLSACGSKGGNGGPGNKDADGYQGLPGDPRANVAPLPNNNGGANGDPGQDGKPGSPGNSGVRGTASTAPGIFSAAGFTPAAPGGNGIDGFPGQGGGGGGASNATGSCIGASGGAGGMGGCGGKLGTGGASGGASVAILSWNSDVTLDACQLISAAGGAGGKGGNGGPGGNGKDGAVGGAAYAVDGGIPIGNGGKGGFGGIGGPGGSGAGGNGGPSYALVYSGTAPAKQNGTTVTPGAGGAKGLGGSVLTLPAPDGAVGASAAEYPVP